MTAKRSWLKTPRALHRHAKHIAEELGPSYNAPGVTKHDVTVARRHLRDVYLEGYQDAIQSVLGAVNKMGLNGHFVGNLLSNVHANPLPGPHDHDECPCKHPWGTQGPCAGCNCADPVP